MVIMGKEKEIRHNCVCTKIWGIMWEWGRCKWRLNLSNHLGSNFMFVHLSLAKPHTWVLVGEIRVFLLASYLTVTSSTTKIANMANCW